VEVYKKEKQSMATLKSIEVTECDNELIGIVVPSGPTASVELFHFKLGGGITAAPINYTVPIEGYNVLPSGNYTLLLIGINWAGPAPNPANFKVTLNGPGTVLTYSNPSPAVGVVWTPAGVPFTV
jgi:hypothetical protein